MQATKEWTIHDIESLTYPEVLLMDCEWVDIKGHDVALVDFRDYFGYSALVFLNGGHLKHANDYELHHRNKTHDELREYYIKKLSHELFTEEELVSPGSDYCEQKRKRDYLVNDYSHQWPYVSGFGSKPDNWDELKRSMLFSHISWCYYDRAYEQGVRRMHELWDRLSDVSRSMQDDHDYLVKAIIHEMGNHEYHINWQGNWEVLGCFSDVNLEYDHKDDDQNLDFYFEQMGWSDEKRSWYMEARREYHRLCEENNWW